MLKFLRSMSAGKLFASWVGYWILLIGIGFRPALVAVWRATRDTPEHGSLNLSFGDAGFVLDVVKGGAKLYSGSIQPLPLALLVAGPPLAIWLLWVASRSKRSSPDAMMGG